PADGPDIYRSFVLPLNLPEDKWVRAIEFRPGARTVVHHSLFFYDTTGSARQRDRADPRPGYDRGMGGFSRSASSRKDSMPEYSSPSVSAPTGSLGGWAVGAPAVSLPEGLAWYLPKGADLILATHFHPSGKPEQEISTFGLYFADRAPRRQFTSIQLPPAFAALEGLDIPPGAKEYLIEDSFTLPVDARAFIISAHAHYLGKQMKLSAQLPDGQTQVLLWIRDWDFNWQGAYQFQEFVALPKGTRLAATITYDNSADNPRNPSSPPQRVRWGEGSTDEMGSLTLLVVAENETDLSRLKKDYGQHVKSAFLSLKGLKQMARQLFKS
ncbi:MAG: hypothetical protein L0Y32_02910, partial [Nevskiales bacterium]|nr:hypothetical protein [Nevskiales bacterium]